MLNAGQYLDDNPTQAWNGPAIAGLTHGFADADVERRFMSAMLVQNRHRLYFLVGISALLTAVSIVATTFGLVADDGAASSLPPRMIQLALCGVGALLALRARTPRAIEALALAYGIMFVVMRCVIIGRLPADATPGLMIGGLALLYFGLPLRLSILAPLMAAISGAMLAAWFARGPSPSSMLSVVEWVWVINLLGIVAVRTMRLTLRRQWSQTQALHHMATHDGLTGIANRRYYDQVLAREWARCRETATPLSVILVDVDHFRLLNDCVGPAAGDACLRDLAIVLENTALRPADLVARTGGEEFAILLPETGEQAARAAANRIAGAVAGAAIAHPSSPLGPYVTVSLGVATAQPDEGFSAWELTALADRMVDRAKRHGRNRIRQQTLGGVTAGVPCFLPDAGGSFVLAGEDAVSAE